MGDVSFNLNTVNLDKMFKHGDSLQELGNAASLADANFTKFEGLKNTATETFNKSDKEAKDYGEQETKLQADLQAVQSGESAPCFKTIVSARDCELQRLDSKMQSEIGRVDKNAEDAESQINSIKEKYNEQIEAKKKEYEQKIEDERKNQIDSLNKELGEVQKKKTEAEGEAQKAKSDETENDNKAQEAQQESRDIDTEIQKATEVANKKQEEFKNEQTVAKQQEAIDAFVNKYSLMAEKANTVEELESIKGMASNMLSGNDKADLSGVNSLIGTIDGKIDGIKKQQEAEEAKKAQEAEEAKDAEKTGDTEETKDTAPTQETKGKEKVDANGEPVEEKVSDEDANPPAAFTPMTKDGLKSFSKDSKAAIKDLNASIKNPDDREKAKAGVQSQLDAINEQLANYNESEFGDVSKKDLEKEKAKLEKALNKFENKSTKYDTKTALDNLNVANDCIKGGLKGSDDLAQTRCEDAQKQINSLDEKIKQAEANGDTKTVKALTKQKNKLEQAQTQTYMNMYASQGDIGALQDVKAYAEEHGMKGIAKDAEKAINNTQKQEANAAAQEAITKLNSNATGSREDALKYINNLRDSIDNGTYSKDVKKSYEKTIKTMEKALTEYDNAEIKNKSNDAIKGIKGDKLNRGSYKTAQDTRTELNNQLSDPTITSSTKKYLQKQLKNLDKAIADAEKRYPNIKNPLGDFPQNSIG